MNGIYGTMLVAFAFAAVGLSQAHPFAQAEGHSARFVVVDGADGRAIRGATLELAIPGLPVRTSETTGDGVGGVDGAGVHGVLTFTADGFAPARLVWPARMGQETTVRLSRGASLRVSLIDRRSGSPVPGSVAVLLRSRGNRGTFSEVAPNGTAEFFSLAPGTATLIVKAERFAPAVFTIELRTGQAEAQAVTLSEAATVEGVVLDSDGRPLSGAVMTVDYGSAANEQRILAQLIGGRTRTGSDGAFRLTGIVPNTLLRVRATSNGRVVASSVPLVIDEGTRATGATLRVMAP